MSRFIFMLCHHRAEQIDLCLENARRVTSNGLANFVLLDQHYPLPSEQEQHEELRNVVDKYGVTLMDAGEGLGCRNGINYLADKCNVGAGDTIFIYDPDARVVTKDWDLDLQRVSMDPSVAYVSVLTPEAEEELATRGKATRKINGVDCLIPLVPCVAAVDAMDGGYFREIGGYLDGGGDYGHFEIANWPVAMARGRFPCYAAHHFEAHWNPRDWIVDPEYLEWKRYYGMKQIKLSFNAFLKLKREGTQFYDPPGCNSTEY